MNKGKKPIPDDWRRQGQEKFLMGVKLFLQKYHSSRLNWEHDHCEFCGAKFSLFEGDLKDGYSTEGGYHWVCISCYEDFSEEFGWKS